ncbi:MAG TPA: translation factor GTPase family protein [Streptosporangiaceae bacterium]
MHSLNLGILAHVDAGKTSLTERLLFAAGVIDEIGRVDDGSTQTDSLALERQRGITIKAAVVSFRVGDLVVNLIDTPGHPDFIAEVERTLGVLDGAVLVISAVEGVQAQTRVLMRTLRRLRIPTLLFVNKIDRGGAQPDRVLAEIAARLTPAVMAMGMVIDPGTRRAGWLPFGPADAAHAGRLGDVLAEHDDAFLAAYLDDDQAPPYPRLHAELAAQTRRALVHPVYFGSAITGAGVSCLMAGLAEFLPTGCDDARGPAAGTVFKVERGPAGEKVAYVRMFTGTLRAREPVPYGCGSDGKITALSVLSGGPAVPSPAVTAGQIAKICGLPGVQVGDPIGPAAAAARQHLFAPPTLETVVVPARAADRPALHAALTQLAEQDPLINLRQDDIRHELLVSLYGEVQKEVIQATLADEFGLQVDFRETTPICVERVLGAGAAAEQMDAGDNPFRATVGLRIEPGPAGSGVSFRLEVELGSMPLAFMKAVEETARDTLKQGLHGWQVIDCVVTLTQTGYVPPPPYGWSKWSSSAGDFRNLTPLVLMSALRQARTVVCEPVSSFRLEVPPECVPPVLTVLGRLRATQQTPELRGESSVVTGEMPAGQVHQLQHQLPTLTRGEGTLESEFGRYQPVRGAPPARQRTDHNPLDRREYLLHVQRGLGALRGIDSAGRSLWPGKHGNYGLPTGRGS